MNATSTRAIVCVCATGAIACGRSERADYTATAMVSSEEVVGTTGPANQPIAVSGCIVRVAPDGYELTSLDDAIVREERGTSGRRDPTKPTVPNRGAEEERARHGLNVSAEFTRYRLVGDARHLATFVDREVDLSGRLLPDDGDSRTPLTMQVESIRETGAACGERQEEGNDRGGLPTQDLPRD